MRISGKQVYFIREGIFIIHEEHKMKEWDDNSSMIDDWCWDNYGADYHMTALIMCSICRRFMPTV